MKVREDSVTLPDQQRPFHRCHTRREQADSAHNLGVTTPYGEIPWPKLSRLSDEEMKKKPDD